jgi:hypothetical protein
VLIYNHPAQNGAGCKLRELSIGAVEGRSGDGSDKARVGRNAVLDLIFDDRGQGEGAEVAGRREAAAAFQHQRPLKKQNVVAARTDVQIAGEERLAPVNAAAVAVPRRVYLVVISLRVLVVAVGIEICAVASLLNLDDRPLLVVAVAAALVPRVLHRLGDLQRPVPYRPMVGFCRYLVALPDVADLDGRVAVADDELEGFERRFNDAADLGVAFRSQQRTVRADDAVDVHIDRREDGRSVAAADVDAGVSFEAAVLIDADFVSAERLDKRAGGSESVRESLGYLVHMVVLDDDKKTLELVVRRV